MTFDSRERKRSKYLSYPYINLEPRHKGLPASIEGSRTHILSHKGEGSSVATNQFNGSPSTAKSGNKKFRSNWCRKFIRWQTTSSIPDFINASSAELLSGLYSKAVGCNFPNENKRPDLVECFFCTYRLSAFHDEAELAASLINLKGGYSGTPIRNDSLNVTEQEKRKKKKLEHAPRHRTKSLSSQSDMNIGIATSEFLSKCSIETNTGGNVEEVIPLIHLQNVGTTTFERSRAKSSSPKDPQVHSCLGSEGAAVPKRRKKTVAAKENKSSETFSSLLEVGEKSNKCSSLVIDLQMLSPSTNGTAEKTNGESKEELDLIGSISQPVLVGNIANHNLSVSTISEVTVASVNKKSRQRRQKRKEKAPEEHLKTRLASMIADLNGSRTEYNSTRKELEDVNGFAPELKYIHIQNMDPEEPRTDVSKSIFASIGLTQTINNNRMEANGDALGTSLLLQFDTRGSLPSKADLLTMFCRFGPLMVSETKILNDGHAQIVFVRSADAGKAFRSIEQDKTFGATLIDYKLHHLSATIPPVDQHVTITGPSGSKPPYFERPSLDFIRQNLQMMASTLEKSGDNISPLTRDKLEGEINNLLKKVNSMDGSFNMKV